MTVPYISVPSWHVRRPRAVAAPRPAKMPARPREHARDRRIAWIDVTIQVVGLAIVGALLWAVVWVGAFDRGMGAFSGWYVDAVAPEFDPIPHLPWRQFWDGYFVDEAQLPIGLVRPEHLVEPRTSLLAGG